ncbi:hypothetical protein [Rhizobium sp. RAF56]|jgi:hypothetical protein|uniref:hypothetical protein n=1 Tax=Rhizobium sp. RAF56 TaxID=3233062 RepID=UPI003F9D643B
MRQAFLRLDHSSETGFQFVVATVQLRIPHCQSSPTPYFGYMEQQVTKVRSLTGTAKLDATTAAAYEIIDKRVRDRDLKTAKLRAQRLEREAREAAAKAAEQRRAKPRREPANSTKSKPRTSS